MTSCLFQTWKTGKPQGFYHHWNFPSCLGSTDGKLLPTLAHTTTISRGLFPLFFWLWLMLSFQCGCHKPEPDASFPRHQPPQRAEGLQLLVVECACGFPAVENVQVIYWSATAKSHVKTTFISQNILRCISPRKEQRGSDPNPVPEYSCHVAFQEVYRMRANNTTPEAVRVRATFTSYLNQQGAVSRQNHI
ncbi:hypothetical protein P4O66_013315 [Electrophorus voltai]|uniref:Uncharacterized protein n=1 Tax=Electrophorus voltai TaxID=2609070 RepID=A0AAD8Z1I4_9TELE|nr:hypothetical protein P4O66_013315 [Electrophorus voltai]